MKNIIQFTKLRFIMFALSILLIIGGIVGIIVNDGFNLGIDFQAGLSQRVQIADPALQIRNTGNGDIRINMAGGDVIVELRDADGVQSWTLTTEEYPTVSQLAAGLQNVAPLEVQVLGNTGSAPADSITTGLGLPFELNESEDTAVLNVKNADESSYVSISEVRSALEGLGSLQVQVVGNAYEQEFLVRTEDTEGGQKESLEAEVQSRLESAFGDQHVLVKRSDYVGPQFSADLARQSVVLVIVALVLILAYVWFRFRLGFAVSSITALAHDILIMIGFIAAARIEVNTATIAAVLTIIGYSLNDTIVVFDRIRENTDLMVDRPFETVVNASITQSLSRTLITSLTTMLAVLALYIFGTGAIKDFALNLIVGIIVGTYSSIFIASPVLLGWTNKARQKKARHLGTASAVSSGQTRTVKTAGEIAETRSAGTAKKANEKAASSTASGKKASPKAAVKESAEIPKVERKQKGKRQQKKKKKN